MAAPSSPERPSLPAAVLPWALLGLMEVYLALGAVGPHPWGRYLAEVGVLAAAGAVLGRGLPSFPGLAPVAAPLLPVVIALATRIPGGIEGLVYAVGLAVVVGAPVGLAARRRPIPVWASCVLVVPATLFQHVLFGVGLEGPMPPGLGSKLAHDLSWPARRPSLPEPAEVGPPVVVISVDTLRADSARDMASWERLTERGAWWDRAMSTSSWTLPAVASLQTGLMPADHGAGCIYGEEGEHCQGLEPEVTTLAEDLAERGYATVGITSNPWSGRTSGFERGFDAFLDLGNDPPRYLALMGTGLVGRHHQDAAVVTDLALDWLDRLDGSFYLWVHYLDPHLPYDHSEEYRTLDVSALRNAELLTEETRQDIRDAYHHEVAYTDAQITRLLDALQQRGLLDEALVVLTSDHGEELWDRGGFEHGHTHHAEVIEVPLVLSGPGIPTGRRSGTASLVDVASTVRAAVGLEPDGIDLRGPLPEGRVAAAQGNLHTWLACSARDEETRVIVDDCGGSEPRIHRYDLSEDPEERFPLPSDPADPVQVTAEQVREPARGEAAAQNTEALRALGYVQ